MRSLTATLEAEQQDSSVAALYRFVIDGDTFSQARILEIEHIEEQFHQQARILLDDSDAVVSAKDYEGLEGVLSYGATTALPGDEFSAVAPLTVIAQQKHSSQGPLTTEFIAVGLYDLIAEDHASDQFTMEASDTRTVKTLIKAVIEATLPQFSHTVAYTATFDTEDSLMDSFKPANGFSFSLNATRREVVRELLALTKSHTRVEADGAFHFFVPTAQGRDWVASTAYSLQDYVQDPTSPANNFAFRCTTAGTTGGSEPTWPTSAGATVADGTVVWTAVNFEEEYRVNVTAQHELLNKADRRRLVQPNRFEVLSHPDSDDAFSGTAEFTDSSDILNMERRVFVYATLTSNAEATDLAEALLDSAILDAQSGAALAPLNVAQETGDLIKLTDSRDGGAVSIGNISAIQRIVGHGRWQIQFAFGGIRQVGFAGLFLSPEMLTQLAGPLLVPSTGDALADVVAQFNAIANDLSSRMAQGFAALNQSINALFANDQAFAQEIGTIVAQTVGVQLQRVIARLQVTERLQAPVGVDKKD